MKWKRVDDKTIYKMWYHDMYVKDYILQSLTVNKALWQSYCPCYIPGSIHTDRAFLCFVVEYRFIYSYTPDWIKLLALRVISLKYGPDSKAHRANMGPIWGRQDPGGPHVGHMNLVIWG